MGHQLDMNKRLEALDFLRGLAIFGVIGVQPGDNGLLVLLLMLRLVTLISDCLSILLYHMIEKPVQLVFRSIPHASPVTPPMTILPA